ncbi:MAG: hypothetical protein WBW53_15760 [Terriglobales bacterium]
MRFTRYLALVGALSILLPVCAFAGNKNERSVNITDSVQVGGTQLKPGNYKVEWENAGPAVQVTFLQHGKTVATAPATLKTNDSQVTQDDIVVSTRSQHKVLSEIDFSHQKEALIFG